MRHFNGRGFGREDGCGNGHGRGHSHGCGRDHHHRLEQFFGGIGRCDVEGGTDRRFAGRGGFGSRGAGRGGFADRGRGHGHGHGHGPGPGGRHGGGGLFGHLADMAQMRAGRVLSSDDLQIAILWLTELKPRHGYDIIKELADRSSGVYKPSPGMIYPALQYLEEAGLVTATTEGAKKLVSLTEQGKAELDVRRERAEQIFEHLKMYGERVSEFQRDQEDQGDFRDLRHELRAALREKFNASLEEKKRVFEILRKAIRDIRKT